MATQLQESKLDEILNSIRKNALELADSRYTDIQMIKTAVNRGTKLLNGKITERYWCDWPGFDFEKNLIKKALD